MLCSVMENSVNVSLLGAQGWAHEGLVLSQLRIQRCTNAVLEFPQFGGISQDGDVSVALEIDRRAFGRILALL